MNLLPQTLLGAVAATGLRAVTQLITSHADEPGRVFLLSNQRAEPAGLAGDYFAWNRARWEAIAFATRQLGANPRMLDGGFVYNGLFNFERMRLSGSRQGKSLWWVEDDRYQVAFSGRAGYQV